MAGAGMAVEDLFARDSFAPISASGVEEDSSLAGLTAAGLAALQRQDFEPLSGCGLRGFIATAVSDPPIFGCRLSQADMSQVYTLTEDITLDEPLPTITRDLVIDGDGYGISGGGGMRVFHVQGASLTLQNVTLGNGGGVEAGGAILVDDGGLLSATDVNFSDNAAGRGGAIAALGSSEIFIVQSGFSSNSAERGGGAILLDGGYLSMVDSVLLGNRAGVSSAQFDHLGGAIAVSSGRAEVFSSSFYGNSAAQGGAADSADAVLALESISAGGNEASA